MVRVRKSASLLAVLLLMIGCSPQPPDDGLAFYVATTGDDSNPGTEALPWRTLAKAASTATAGVTVYIKQGTYNERLVPKSSGTADGPTTFAAYPGHSVTIDGTGSDFPAGTAGGNWWNGLIHIEGLSHVRIVGLKVIHSPGSGILARNCSHITIEQNSVADTYSPGTCAHTCDHVLIAGNEVSYACTGGDQESISISMTDSFDIRNNLIHDGLKEGIDVKDGSSNGIVSGNVVSNQAAGRPGIYIDAWDGHEFNIEVFGNISHDNGNGFTVASENGGLLEAIAIHHNIAYGNFRGFNVAGWGVSQTHPIKNIEIHANRCYRNTIGVEIAGFTGSSFDGIKVYNNVIYRNTSAGIRITRYDDPPGDYLMRDMEIVNNTIFGNGTSASGWDDGGINLFNVNPENMVIRNNLVSGNAAYTICIHQPDGALVDVTVDHNLLDGFANFPSETQGSNPFFGAPSFISSSDSIFHLSPGSAAIDNGSPLNAPSVDFDGAARPQGTGIDIGAFELVY